MKRHKRIRHTLTYAQISKAEFFASEVKGWNAWEVTLVFRNKANKIVASINTWDDPKAHGCIVRWFDGRYYFLPYKGKKAKPYTMTLAKLKYLKDRLA